MAEGWHILVVDIHRDGRGTVWYTAEDRENVREDFRLVGSAEFDQIKELFPPARRI